MHDEDDVDDDGVCVALAAAIARGSDDLCIGHSALRYLLVMTVLMKVCHRINPKI